MTQKTFDIQIGFVGKFLQEANKEHEKGEEALSKHYLSVVIQETEKLIKMFPKVYK